jgi:hypothetical protein
MVDRMHGFHRFEPRRLSFHRLELVEDSESLIRGKN